ncbi:50S ribosomal protein L10 [Caminicella sporogenes]|uniref:50S ribosomal protein L10 n=1 Tax=Caminicella sporogenes TaxID=166485 RepID=UPI0025415820|nr:50S ribosomal protein L10 [Caminicella sporogenes]WIF95603.1 50S ribosomal protein L10 [Caminicella sporogenes]
MSKNLEIKKAQVEEIKDKLSRAQAAVLVNYRGLTVAEATELRKKFREAGVEYKVYKNNLLKIAIKGTDFEALEKDLTGPNAIAFGYEDPVMPAKIVKEFSKKHEALELKSGIVEGEYCDLEKIKAIADIPSKEVLIGKFLGSIKSPLSNFAYLLQAIIDKKNEEGSIEA